MNQHDSDFGELLRLALHAEADSIEPAGDGLERIRARLIACQEVARGALRRGFGRALVRPCPESRDPSALAPAPPPTPSAA